MRYALFFLAAAACLAPAAVSAEDSAAPRKVIIDQDAYGPAGSNLQSILMLIQSPGVQVEGNLRTVKRHLLICAECREEDQTLASVSGKIGKNQYKSEDFLLT